MRLVLKFTCRSGLLWRPLSPRLYSLKGEKKTKRKKRPPENNALKIKRALSKKIKRRVVEGRRKKYALQKKKGAS